MVVLKCSLAILFLLTMVIGGEEKPKNNLITLGGECSQGKWLQDIQKKAPDFPMFPFCGMAINSYRRYEPYKCSIGEGKGSEPFKVKCGGGGLKWDRSNGVIFQTCHYQKWNWKGVEMQKGPYWYHKSIQSCPTNYWISGFRYKTHPDDGLSGVIIECTAFNNPSLKRSYNVKDGRGTWSDMIKLDSNFASAYDLQMAEGDGGKYITGIRVRMMPFPVPSQMSFKFDSAPAIAPEKKSLFCVNFTNPDKVKKKNVVLNPMAYSGRRQNWRYYYKNLYSQYEGINFDTYLIPKRDITIQIPYIETQIDSSTNSLSTNYIGFRDYVVQQNFYFNRWMYRTIPPQPTQKYTLGPCERLEVEEITYQKYMVLPYTMFLLFKSGDTSNLQQMRGLFTGYLFSKPQLFTKKSYIC